MGLFGKSKKEKEAEYMERINVPQCLQQDFIMKVGGVFAIAGNGTVVAGRIESGMCRVGETAFILQNGTALEVVITGIDLRTMLMCDKVTLEFDRQQPIIPILYFDAENSIIHSINYVIIGAANLANKYV